MKATEMKVTYIDPDMRQLFVEKLPDGGYGVWCQKDKHAPRKLMAASIRKDGRRQGRHQHGRPGNAKCRLPSQADGENPRQGEVV